LRLIKKRVQIKRVQETAFESEIKRRDAGANGATEPYHCNRGLDEYGERLGGNGFLAFIKEKLAENKEVRILDLGSSPVFARELREHLGTKAEKIHLTGLSLSPENGGEFDEHFQGVFPAEYPEKKFHVILDVEGPHTYLEQSGFKLEEYLKKVRELLEPRGRAFIEAHGIKRVPYGKVNGRAMNVYG
jgi:hypothetical protein